MQKRMQIALEFMILFSFVLILFLFIFAVIASQRAQTLSNQLFSQEQLVAQNVAAQLDRALQSGDGYNAGVPLTGTIGTLPYQLIVTKNGAVIVNASVNKEVIQAISYSSVKNLVTNPSYLQAGTPYYIIPISNGTLSVQNSFGTICVDYACPTIGTQAANVTLSAQTVNVGQFNGYSSYLTAANVPGLNNQMTVSLWVDFATAAPTQHLINIDTSGIGTDQMSLKFNNNLIYFFSGGGSCYAFTSMTPVVSGWYNIIVTFSAGSYAIYVNGRSSTPSTVGSCSALSTSGTKTYIGGFTGQILNGRMGNIQVYNTALSSSQAKALYAQGISSSPIMPTNTVAWWPLDGDTNDYSGNGNNGAINSPILFPTASEIFAKVANQRGYAINNALVGFSTTLGNFAGSSVTVNYTNTNGIAVAFLNQKLNNGKAIVQATAFNGNYSLQGNLLYWAPMSLEQGNTTADISGNADTGYIRGYSAWTDPQYVAGFNGKDSVIYIPPSTALSLSTQTWSFWFSPSSALFPSMRLFAIGNPSAASPTGIEASINTNLGLRFSALGSNCDSLTPISAGIWYHAVATWDGTNLICYLNGIEQASKTSSSGTITTTSPVFIGANSLTPSGTFFSGRVADVQAYSKALTGSQVFQLYNTGPSSPPLVSSGVAGWWPLNGDAVDYGYQGNNGTVIGNVNFVRSPVNASISNNATSIVTASFNGINSNVITPITQNLITSYTVTLWANPANQLVMTSSNGYSIFNSMDIAGSNTLQLWLNSGGGLGSVPGSGDEEVGLGSSTYSGYGISNSTWNFLAVAVSSTVLSIYANGAPPYNISIAQGPFSLNGLTIGAPSKGIGSYNGLLANIQVYNTTLSPTQVNKIYKQGVAGIPLNTSTKNLKLLAWYPLNGNAHDFSGQNNNATASNTVSYLQQTVSLPATAAPISGAGLGFNGQTGYVSLPAGQTLLSTTTMTSGSVALWADPYSYNLGNNQCCTGEETLIGLGKTNTNSYPDGGNELAITLSDNSGDTPNNNQLMWTDTGTSNLQVFTSPTMPLNAWSFLVLNFSPAGSTAYVNGQVVKTWTSPGTITFDSGPSWLASWHGAENFFNGSIANVQIYQTSLTGAQVTQLYKSQLPPSTTATIPLSWSP